MRCLLSCCFGFLGEEDDKTGNKIVDEIENVLDKNPNPSINLLDELSMKFIEGFSKLIETDFEIVDKPLDCLSLGIEARENKIRKFFFCPGDWIFFAPIPEGLSTYQALNDLSKEI